MKEYEFRLRNGEMDSIGRLKSLKQFDEDGNIVLLEQYCILYCSDSQKSDTHRTEYEYNQQGLMSRNEFTLSVDDSIKEKSIATYSYEFNEQGLLTTKIIITEKSDDQRKFILWGHTIELFDYDENGNISRKTSRSIYSEDTFDFIEDYTYIDNGYLIRLGYPHEETRSTKKFIFDKNGNQVEYEFIQRHGCSLETGRWKKKYDDINKVIKKIHDHMERAEGPFTVTRYEYNEKGLLEQKVMQYEQLPSSSRLYKYNKYGDLIETKNKNNQGKLFSLRTFTYEYY